jgi:hypothetical protein
MRGSNASGSHNVQPKVLYEPLGLFKGPGSAVAPARIRNSNAYRRGLCAGFDGGRRGGNRLRIIVRQGLAGQFSRLMRKATPGGQWPIRLSCKIAAPPHF